MWWNHQNLETRPRDASGVVWHFRVWHDHVGGTYTQRILCSATTTSRRVVSSSFAGIVAALHGTQSMPVFMEERQAWQPQR